MYKAFAGPIFSDEFAYVALFMLCAPIVIALTVAAVLTYSVTVRRRGKKITTQKLLLVGGMSTIIAVPVSIVLVTAWARGTTSSYEASNLASEKQYLEKRYRSNNAEFPQSYDHSMAKISEGCKDMQASTETTMSGFAWSLDVIDEDKKPLTLLKAQNGLGPLPLCPEVSITKDGHSIPLSSLSYGTKLTITHKRVQTGVYYEEVATAITVR